MEAQWAVCADTSPAPHSKCICYKAIWAKANETFANVLIYKEKIGSPEWQGLYAKQMFFFAIF